MLSQDLDRYLDLKQATGYKYREPKRLLRHFVTFAEAAGDDVILTDRVLDWANRAPSPQARRNRLLTVRRFALATRAEDPRHEVPAAEAFGCETYRRRPPYIYSGDEIARLIAAANQLGPAGSIRPLTYATPFGLLAATGLRISEALALTVRDVTADGLIIRETKFRKNRLVPVHDTTRQALDAYLARRAGLGTMVDTFFVSTTGKTPAAVTVEAVFRRLTRSIGLKGQAGRREPRLHDLRHTFAVHALERCRHDREAVPGHAAALSTYLGHACIRDTYWYLEATPVLLARIAEAGETMFRRGEP